MRMKEDNMKNDQLKADYNLQVATNSQYILGYGLFPNPTDTRTLRPFLMTLKENFFELSTYYGIWRGRKLSGCFRRFPLLRMLCIIENKRKNSNKIRFFPKIGRIWS